jgi:phosphoglycerate dehydrogenase-like enzyme
MRILTQMGGGVADAIRAAAPSAEVSVVPLSGPVDSGMAGQVLVASHRADNLVELCGRGVEWVHFFGTGVDGMPAEVLEGRIVTCSRGAGSVPISEWVLAVMLAFEKHLPDTFVREPPQRWSWAELGGLSGRTLGLVGLGGIGSAIAARALAFGMDVRALRRTEAASPVAGVQVVSSLTELLPASDHLVLAAPATQRTRHLLDDAAFGLVQPGVHLVNIARGALLDQDALRRSLDDGRVARASLDVCEPEPLPEGHWLYSHPRVRLSPHISWSSPELGGRIVELLIDNVRRFVAGQPLEGIVDPVEGY